MKILVNDGKGGVEVVTAAPEWVARQLENDPKVKTEIDALNKLIPKAVMPELTTRIIEDSILPERTFRDAWTDDLSGDQIDVDMPRARDIHMDRIRAARKEKLEILDIETMKGIDVQAEKQVLRDLPANTDLSVATTPEQLKAIWPVELEGV